MSVHAREYDQCGGGEGDLWGATGDGQGDWKKGDQGGLGEVDQGGAREGDKGGACEDVQGCGGYNDQGGVGEGDQESAGEGDQRGIWMCDPRDAR